MKYFLFLLLPALTMTAQASEILSSSPEGAKIFIISPKTGDRVKSPITIKFGIEGMEIAPAGTNRENTGHHHLLIDGKQLPNLKIPLGAEVTHFGKGQTETTIALTEGEHTLQLILGNYLHTPHDPAVISEMITVKVKN